MERPMAQQLDDLSRSLTPLEQDSTIISVARVEHGKDAERGFLVGSGDDDKIAALGEVHGKAAPLTIAEHFEPLPEQPRVLDHPGPRILELAGIRQG